MKLPSYDAFLCATYYNKSHNLLRHHLDPRRMQPNRQVNHKVLGRGQIVYAPRGGISSETPEQEKRRSDGYVVNGRLRRHGNSETEFAGRMGEAYRPIVFLTGQPQVGPEWTAFLRDSANQQHYCSGVLEQNTDGLHDRRHQEHR